MLIDKFAPTRGTEAGEDRLLEMPEERSMGQVVAAIGPEQLRDFMRILQKYNSGLARTKARIRESENWWKLRNHIEERKTTQQGKDGGWTSVSGWLHNVIVSKHADAVEAYPEANILPRESGDRAEARILSSIIPCILEQNHFEQVYSDAMWQKCKTGTAAYKIVWDAAKLNGLGDISIERINLLNLYWEPGVTDIQHSRYLFHTELMDKDLLEEQYPQTKGKLKGQDFISAKFLYDDSVDTTDKHTVVEVYYHKGKILHYCKFVGDVVLYATENEPEMSGRGLYDHGKYPYDFDPLFPIEGSPCGYGYVDVCRNPQTEIDLLKTAMVKNAQVGAIPRYFFRQDGAVNEQEFLDLSNPLVHVNGNLGEDSLRRIEHPNLDGNYINLLNNTVQELRETSGNTETATGTSTAGVTAASAIAALQEASGKGSKDATRGAYRSFSRIIELVVELIRQFYDMPRRFRIVGQYGMEQFITYSNQGIQPQAQGMAFGQDMGIRLPVFDIRVSAQKKSGYTKVTQNELALQFFQLGFFNPQLTDQALMTLDMMEFDGKDEVLQKISRNGTLQQKLIQYMQLALALAQKSAPQLVQGLSQDIMATMGGASPSGTASADILQGDPVSGMEKEEHAFVEKARAQANQASQPEGEVVERK